MLKKLISSMLIICIICISYPFNSVHASGLYTIVFDTITCVRQEDSTGKDDPIIEVDGTVIWDDEKMKSGDELLIDHYYTTKNDYVTIKLKEGDLLDPDDILGTKRINLTLLKDGDTETLKFKAHGAYYQIVIGVALQ